MNLAEVRQLPDAELSAMVAEHVMEWESVPSPSGDYVTWLDERDRHRHTWVAAERFRGLLVWNPAASIADTWEVWLQFTGEQWDSSLHALRTGEFQVSICDEARSISAHVIADSAPRAICLAALLAKGVIEA